jgi:threonine dehydrogenase-like Zn-dependent dehydrogenase
MIVADMCADALIHARRLGATRIVNVMEESLQDVILEMTEGRGADVSVEVTGRRHHCAGSRTSRA